VPEGMGLIVRTAGAAAHQDRDQARLRISAALWETVRELTLKSSAPALVYEEGDLIKRSIRDLYSKEIDESPGRGRGRLPEAKDFMKMLMPSHAKNALQGHPPLFTRSPGREPARRDVHAQS
jgi:ribonuclease E